MSHTPGPWHVSLPDDTLVLSSDGRVIATTFLDEDDYQVNYDPCAANAELIAAAPSLLDALKLIRDTPETSAGYMRTIAEAAIMKAEGRS